MNLKQLITLTVFLFTFTQGNSQLRDSDRMYFSNYIFLKVSPNTLFDNKGGLVPVSLEYTFNEEWGVQVDIGVPILAELVWKDEGKQIQGDFRIGGAMKWYYGGHGNARGFVGMELFYRQQKAHWAPGGYFNTSHVTFSSADALLQSRVGSVIVGFQRMLSRTLLLEGQTGLGVNYRSIEWSNIKDEKYIGDFEGMWVNDDRSIGSAILPFIPMRISLSLLLGSTKRRYW